MSRGLIVEWEFQSTAFNQGVIAGCSVDVHERFFGFSLNRVLDPGLRNLLINTPQFSKAPNCAEGPNPRWVSFEVDGEFASDIDRIFK
jgi:hypothetical protein